MQKRDLIRLFAVCGLLAGCATGPDYKQPDVAAPEVWSVESGGGIVAGQEAASAWWATLGDPVLNDLIARGAQANLDVHVAEARVREARAARGVAASALWPGLGAGASAARQQQPKQPGGDSGAVSLGLGAGPTGLSRTVAVRGRNVTVSRTQSAAGATTNATITPGGQDTPDRTVDLFAAGFDASWELDVFGGNRRAIEAADAAIGAAEAQRDAVLVSVLAEIAMNYIELRTAQNRLSITQKNIEAQGETVRLTRARFEAGLSSELDAIRAEALLSATQSQVPLLETQAMTAIHRLSVLLGEQPDALREPLAAAAPIPAAPGAVPVGLPADLLRRRPDIRRAERELAAATARIGVATADLFPRFYLTGAASGQGGSGGDLFNSGNWLWSLGPAVRWPVLQGGRIRANIAVQNARQEQAAIAYEQAILGALAEVENGLVSFAQEQVRRGSLEAAVRANASAVRLANERYVRGLDGFLNVLLAEQQLFQSEDQLVQSEGFVLTSLVALYKALGGGWNAALDAGAAEAAE